jgi:hypothetical protein
LIPPLEATADCPRELAEYVHLHADRQFQRDSPLEQMAHSQWFWKRHVPQSHRPRQRIPSVLSLAPSISRQPCTSRRNASQEQLNTSSARCSGDSFLILSLQLITHENLTNMFVCQWIDRIWAIHRRVTWTLRQLFR